MRNLKNIYIEVSLCCAFMFFYLLMHTKTEVVHTKELTTPFVKDNCKRKSRHRRPP